MLGHMPQSMLADCIVSSLQFSASAVSIPWTPNFDNDAYAWYDSNDLSSLTYDTGTLRVSEIANKGFGATGSLVQADPAKQGLLTSDAIRCYGADTYTSTGNLDLTSDMMYISIVKMSDISIDVNFFSSSANLERNRIGYNRQLITDTPSNGLIIKSASTFRSESVILNNATALGEMRVNGVYDNAVTGNNVLTAAPMTFYSNSNLIYMSFAETVWFDKFDTGLMEITEGYIHWNNGMQDDLPIGHKFKSGRPMVDYLLDESGNILVDELDNKLYTVGAENE